MKIIATIIAGALLLGCTAKPKVAEQPDPATFWKDGYAVQTTVKTPEAGDKVISARVNGEWQEFDLVEYPTEFMEWNKRKRIQVITQIKDMMAGKGDKRGIELAGPHNGIVASSGFKRDDAAFSLNNAVKGMGFLPKREKIKEIIAQLKATKESPMPVKLEVLESFYINADSIFAMDKQVSLELYAAPKFMTQSFLNQMYNPISTVVFLDMESYKLKTIVRLLDPYNPELTDYEKDVVDYINIIHSYFHGEFSKEFIAAIYYSTQVYDNSPRGSSPDKGMGRRIVPLLP